MDKIESKIINMLDILEETLNEISKEAIYEDELTPISIIEKVSSAIYLTKKYITEKI